MCLAPGRHGSEVCVTRGADLPVASLSLQFRRCRHYAKTISSHTRSLLRGAPIVRPRHRLPSGLFTRSPQRRSWHPVSFDSSHRPATNNQISAKRRTCAASGHNYWRKEEEEEERRERDEAAFEQNRRCRHSSASSFGVGNLWVVRLR